MKKFLAESAIANLALIAFLMACVVVEQAYGAQAKWALFTIGLVGFSIYAWRRWRAQKPELPPHTGRNPQ
ncbi:MAG: hypothetical protein MPJ78_11905 [Hyphomicrobiaceae bacterium]|nr:hypothetical protein [Hyphomicrobiaceae bacterium]